MTYTAQTWVDGQPILYPVSAARMGVIETGIMNAHYKPTVRVYNSANISLVTTGTWQTLAFDTERWDTEPTSPGMHDPASNTRITFKQAGYYEVQGLVSFAANATGSRGVRVILNGSTATILGQQTQPANAVADTTEVQVGFLYKAAAADFIELQAMQRSGGALNALASTAALQNGIEFMAILDSF